MNRVSISAMAAIVFAGITLAGCEGVREQIRSKDFRDNSPAARPTGAPSPIADVMDMPGWTSQIDVAVAFATENPQNTVLFMQQGGNPQTEAMKKLLVSSEVDAVLANKQKVTLDISRSPDVASRFGIRQTPAVVMIGPGGIPAAQKVGRVTKSEVVSFLK